MRFSPAEADFFQTTGRMFEAPLTGAELRPGPPKPGVPGRANRI